MMPHELLILSLPAAASAFKLGALALAVVLAVRTTERLGPAPVVARSSDWRC